MEIRNMFQEGLDRDIDGALTDEEKERDVVAAIRGTPVDGAFIVSTIAQTLFGELYPAKNFKLGRYEFAWDPYVDDTLVGSSGGSGVRLRVLTAGGDQYHASEQSLTLISDANNEAIVRLSDEVPCFEELEWAGKIREYVRQHDLSLLPENVRDIIRGQQRQARPLEEHAKASLGRAVQNADFYVLGEKIEIKYGSVGEKLDFVLTRLIERVYCKLSMVNIFAESDADVLKILNDGPEPGGLRGTTLNNGDALNEIAQWLEAQHQSHTPVSMGDLRRRYGGMPYGWREIDIAALVARLIVEQKVSVRYDGTTVIGDDPRLADYLRKKSEARKVTVARRIALPEDLMREVTAALRDCWGAMDIPAGEDGLLRFVLRTFEAKADHCGNLIENEYRRERYPWKEVVEAARDLMKDILSRQRDNVALLDHVVRKRDELKKSASDMKEVEAFFKTGKGVFDEALKLRRDLQNESDHFTADAEMTGKLDEISAILEHPNPRDRIGDLGDLTRDLRAARGELLERKKDEAHGLIRECMGDIHTLAGSRNILRDVVTKADDYFTKKKNEVSAAASLTELGAMTPRILDFRDAECRRIEAIIQPARSGDDSAKPKAATVRRHEILPARKLQSREDVDRYIDEIREKLYAALESGDGIQIH
ncbi:MAG: hypothetical protein LBT15_02290 [Synergistaceae bacterium]|nr:hypothetical protein [Synergistaceae bacterium]